MVDPSFEELSRVYKFLFRMVAILPFEGRDFNFIVTRVLSYVMIFSTLLDWMMVFCYDVDVLMKGISLKVEDIYFPLISTGGYYRYYIAIFREQFVNLFQEAAELWDYCDEEGRKTVVKFERKVRFIYKFYIGSTLFFSIAVPINAFITRLPPTETNGTERRLLPYIWFVADDEPYKLLGYHATFTIQTLNALNAVICILTCDVAITALAVLGAGYFRQLSDRLKRCCEDDSRFQYTEILHCIKNHQKLLKYCNNLKNFSETMLFSQIITSCYTMSLLLLKLAGSDPDKYNHLPMLVTCMCQLLLAQWPPDQLSDESAEVAAAAYLALTDRSNDRRLFRDLQIVITRAKVPVYFMAGGFIVLSLETYGQMVKGVYSFYTVLRSFDL